MEELWIDVKKRKPADGVEVLVVCDDNLFYLAEYDKESDSWIETQETIELDTVVTHWQPLVLPLYKSV